MNDDMQKFSHMLTKVAEIDTIKGDLEGTCCICGTETQYGHKKKFGGNFTCADYVSQGNVICPDCRHHRNFEEVFRDCEINRREELREAERNNGLCECEYWESRR